MSADESAAVAAGFESGKFDAAKVAALLDLPKTTVEGRYYHTWKPKIKKLVGAAKAAGRLNPDGSVNEAALQPAKTTARSKKSSTAGPLHRVKTGRVIKKAASKGKATAGSEVEEEEPGIKDETDTNMGSDLFGME
ncbi:hypothetical protein K461DRAFT_31062 [Myriangium duriaei CBS 260.36]|uniref:Uncharacterized protein n=1 Tax=Myriangium duriaei CBS 260.36 TaxID=1168546 RepID=A0A9P4JAZ1_9PEZI|nr:hypothetical protein K461DRAFT_31062 [Myriangium duriaei CBS 260.36]